MLVVEDHPAVLEALVDLLEAEPRLHVAGAYGTAEAALDALPAAAPDVVVTDVRLPGMGGLEMVRRLRADRPGLPVVAISAHPAEVFGPLAELAGAVQFVEKRSVAGHLVRAVRRAHALR